ncbi:sodium:calcium antiporter [Pseudoalteromonas porphyrae]|uniref:Sodium:calcium antiporter n=2 Tax=Pseudoalteromonas TaxID=53246 RepID=A0A0N1F0N7_9GAMM|nr:MULTISPECIES: calcium/sodium antiporter [Pseudoalteromonas]KPH65552.1 sodium:calcium antiporter [Pseudoalteromonas porphyrae]KPH95623.1 sodium:calcium antiporter [Pseudoalteromonas porphyrae]NNG41693.1 calcium/sodium antiporter [Pseudoalteromonas sp. NEC-BIFX-2020_002]
MTNLLFLLLGIALLTLGGEALIRSSLAAAKRFGLSPLLSGLIIVGFGTSAPELVVSIDAAMSHQADIAVGNVVGSNIGNILLILGLCAVITPLTISALALKRDASVMLASSVIFSVLAFNHFISFFDGLLLLAMLFIYLIYTYKTEKQQQSAQALLHVDEANEVTVLPQSLLVSSAMLIAGLALLIVGSKVLLIGAIGVAQAFGISEGVIGLTVVAVGTSLPELTVSVIAALRKHADVAVGNILGSNIFNMLGILGVSALLQPLPLSSRIMHFDQWVLLATSLLLVAFLYTGRRVGRGEGAILLLGYCAYLAVTVNL